MLKWYGWLNHTSHHPSWCIPKTCLSGLGCWSIALRTRCSWDHRSSLVWCRSTWGRIPSRQTSRKSHAGCGPVGNPARHFSEVSTRNGWIVYGMSRISLWFYGMYCIMSFFNTLDSSLNLGLRLYSLLFCIRTHEINAVSTLNLFESYFHASTHQSYTHFTQYQKPNPCDMSNQYWHDFVTWIVLSDQCLMSQWVSKSVGR